MADHVVHIDGGKITVYPGDYDYFKHRQVQWHEENPQAVEVPALEKQSAIPEAPDPKKIARRTAKLQGELHALHQSLEELAAKLSDPELYADYAQVQSVGSEMEKVQELIQSKESELQGLTAS